MICVIWNKNVESFAIVIENSARISFFFEQFRMTLLHVIMLKFSLIVIEWIVRKKIR